MRSSFAYFNFEIAFLQWNLHRECKFLKDPFKIVLYKKNFKKFSYLKRRIL